MRILKKWLAHFVGTKEIERVSHQPGKDVEVFYKKEADLLLSGKIIPIQSVPKMYICIDGTGVRQDRDGQ